MIYGSGIDTKKDMRSNQLAFLYLFSYKTYNNSTYLIINYDKIQAEKKYLSFHLFCTYQNGIKLIIYRNADKTIFLIKLSCFSLEEYALAGIEPGTFY